MPYENCRCSIREKTRKLLTISLGNVAPLYEIENQGGFKAHDKSGINCTTARLAIGAQFARDMIYDAWLASADAIVGHPTVTVRDIEGEKVRATRSLMGSD